MGKSRVKYFCVSDWQERKRNSRVIYEVTSEKGKEKIFWEEMEVK